jgi:hypothetical protein
MDLSFVFAIAIVADAVLLKLIPERKRVARFICTSALVYAPSPTVLFPYGGPRQG